MTYWSYHFLQCVKQAVMACVFVCVLCERANAFQWVFPLPGPAVCEWVWHQIRSPLCSDAELSMACTPAPICAFLLTFHKRLISHAVRGARLHVTHIPTQAEAHRANWINTCTKQSERVMYRCLRCVLLKQLAVRTSLFSSLTSCASIHMPVKARCMALNSWFGSYF